MGSDNSPISELKATETEKQSAINTTIESTTNGTKKSGFVGNNKEGKAEETIPGWTIMRPLKRRAAKGSIDSNGSVDMKKGDTKSATATNDDGYGSGEGLEEVRSDDDLLEHEPGGRLGGNRSIEGVAPGGGSVAEGSFGEFKVYKRRWFGLIQLVLLNIIVSWDWLSFSASSTTVAEYYDVSESAINWLSTGFLFAFVVISPLTIHVLHHHGPKYAIVIASVLLLLGNWIRYGATKAGSHGNFGGVMFGQILTGLAQPFVLAAPTRYSDLWFTNRGRVAATAVASLANPFGGALAQLIDPFWANDPSDIPNMVLYIAIISSIATIPSFFIPPHPPTPVSYSGTQPKQALMPSLKFLSTSPEFYMIMIPYVIYVGLFNSLSSLINQILSPYSFTETDAGIAGALLIVVGLVTSAITSPIIDRTKSFLLAIKVQVPIIAICYLAFLWAPGTRSIAAPYVVLSILGAASFSLVPVVLEYLIEITHPVSPEVSSTICWSGGQLMGAIFIVISDALKDPGESDGTADDGTSRPPGNMYRALIFQAVLACVVVPLPLALGLFGRSKKVSMRRVEADREIAARRDAEGGGRGSTVLS